MQAHLKPSRPATFLPIEPGTTPTACRSCGQMIFFSPHPSTGKPHPISVQSHPASYPPTDTAYGSGITHFADCEFAASHRRKAK